MVVDTRTLLTHYGHLWQVTKAAFTMGIREKDGDFESEKKDSMFYID